MQATAPVVMGIIVVCVVVYILQRMSPEVTTRFVMAPFLVKEGEWWRLFTAMFLHSPSMILHIAFNMFVLYSYGPHVEQAFGHARFGAMYLTAGFAGSAASYAFGSCVGSVGASGAIFGIVGVLAVFFYNRRRSQFVRQYLNGLLVFVGINLLFGFTASGIDNAAHIGGLAGGLALGYGFDNGTRPSTTARQALTVLLVGGAALALVVYGTNTFSCV